MTVLLSLHDVAPPFARQLHELWSLCLSHGVRPALLVVPNWHGAHPLERDRRFVDWLFARVDQGARVFLHGERHDEVERMRGATDALRAFGRTAREGEFLSLDYAAARASMERGREVLMRCGLSPIGFVPPAWLARTATREAARDLGFAFAEDDRRIYLLREGVALRSPAVRWSARSIWRARLSSVVADARWQLQRDHPVLRIALHPTDMDDPEVRRSVERTLARWLREGVMSAGDGYAGLVAASAERRGASPQHGDSSQRGAA
jgi:predicted deacetylase